MKKFLILICFIFSCSVPCFASDTVQLKTSIIDGKILSFSDGLIKIKEGGVTHSFVRSKNSDFYGDYISYRTRPIKGGITNTYCRIIFVDNYNVQFKTKNSIVDVPRYRIKSMVLQAD